MSEISTPKFTHLHVHTHYSLLDGLAKVDDILDRAKELGMDSLAITDHGVLYGAIEFYIKAKARGIKPIIGCEMYLSPTDLHSKNPDSADRKRHHLILLAKNEAGYKNLMRLITIAHLEGFYYKPRIDKTVLRSHSDGLIGLSACAEGEVPSTAISGNMEKAEKLALEYQEIFGVGNFYLELMHHPAYAPQQIANDALIAISKKHNIPLVATNDIHYVKEDDASIQDILLCIQTNRKVDDKNRMNMMDFKLHLKSPDEMAEHFKDVPEALANTQEIVAKCNLEIKLGETQLPHFNVPEGETTETYLRKLTEQGLEKRFKPDDILNVHRDRMEFELSVIEKTGFASYFLIVQDMINWAKNQGIVVGPGRGSAAGSFVSYLIGITNLDPIKYDLLFERFLNPERISMPDIDMDFADDRRDEVLDYVREKYGNDHVAQIITFGTMAARAAIRDAGRALDIPYDFCDKTAKLIPQFSTISEALENAKEFKDLYASSGEAKKLIDSAKRLEGVVRHASMHACGVVITREPVTEYSPLQKIQGKKEGSVTQYSSSTKSSYVEKIGLLKMDFLGLKNLTIMQNALRILKKTKNLDLKIDDIPEHDEKTFKLLQLAQTTGVFQLESSGMKRYLKLLEPSVFEDIIAMVALYRPGPMDWIPDFISRKHGHKKIDYLHPKLKTLLEKTYGVVVYQEQVMQIAQALAGFTLGEADVLRKAMGKKIFALIAEQKIKFIEGCVAHGTERKIAEKVFSYIEPFAGYGFNRCLSGDTLITATSGKQFTLKNLAEQYEKGKKLPQILTLDKLKLKKANISQVFSNGKKAVYLVTTRLGKTIEATSNHPFLTMTGWKKLEELENGKLIALNRTLPIPKKGYAIDDYKLIVLGYLIAEGNLCHPHSFYFYSKNKLEIKDYSINLEKFKNTKATSNDSKSAISIYAGRKNLKQPSEAVVWIKNLGIHYHKAINKELPAFVFELNKNQLSLLIGKMFQGDGCVNIRKNNYPQIFYATSSEKLATQLQHLLLRLNIISSLHKKNFKYRGVIKIGYTLSINRYDNIRNFSFGPGKFLIGEKATTLKKIIQDHSILNGSIKPGSARGSKDIIPCEIKNLITSAIAKKGLSLKEFSRKHNIAPRLLFDDKHKKGYLRETILAIAKALNDEALLEYATSDLYWDEIVSIKPIGTKKTYDLTINGTHNFIANDFIVHNSHAACYAMIGYQTAYLKAHYPAEFMAALLTSDQDDIDRVAIEVTECREMGIEVLPPNVNESFEEFSVITNPENENSKIRFGLNAVKNVGHNVAHEIVEERKRAGRFLNLANFIERVKSKDLNKKSIEALAKVGALEDLGERNQIVASIENILAYSKEHQKNRDSKQISLFGVAELALPEIQLIPTFPAEKKQQLAWEKELIGLYISGHPASEFQAYFEYAGTPIRNIDKNLVGQPVSIGGIISKVKKIFLKNQKTMLFATVEDMYSNIEFIVFPKILDETGSIWIEDKAILASGKISDKDGNFKLLVDSVKIVNQDEVENAARIIATRKTNGIATAKIIITLPQASNQETLKILSAHLGKCESGETKVYLKINSTKLETPYHITKKVELENEIKNLIPGAIIENF